MEKVKKVGKVLPTIGALIVGICIILLNPSAIQSQDTKVATKKKLKRFRSCKEFYEKLKDIFLKYEKRRGSFFIATPAIVSELQGPSKLRGASSSTKPKFSQTNVQVEGVDEGDIVKTDGKYIYVISSKRVAIVQAYPANQAKLLSIIPLSDKEEPKEIYIENNTMIILSKIYVSRYEPLILKKVLRERRGEPYHPSKWLPSYLSNFLVARLYDISDKEHPKLLRKIQFEGYYISSRKIGSFVYIILNHSILHRYFRDDILLLAEKPYIALPQIFDSKAKNKPISLSLCNKIKYVEPLKTPEFLILASISLDNPSFSINKEIILGASDTVYASLNNIYVANSFYDYYSNEPEKFTTLYKFSIKNGKISYEGEGKVPGRVLNQFAMDENGKYFRIVTQTYFPKTATHLYVLDNINLSIVGKVENLGITENLHSTRFMGNRLYMVTFKRIDPFFVIDLSNPTAPKVLGELKIPGFSDYLHPYDENHIIGIGKDTQETSKEFATPSDIKGLKIAIFDVSDPQNPKQKFMVTIGDRGTDSPALREHHSFLFDKDKKLLVIPVYLYEKISNTPPYSYPRPTFSGVYVYEVDLKDGFKLKGRISHQEEQEEELQTPPYHIYYYSSDSLDIKRTLYIEDVLYTISTRKVSAHKLSDLQKITEVGF
jgi:inhibitor of cysteine peptidase